MLGGGSDWVEHHTRKPVCLYWYFRSITFVGLPQSSQQQVGQLRAA